MKTRKKTLRRPLRILWVIDPWQTLDHANDTTLRLATCAEELGAECYLSEVTSLSVEGTAKQPLLSRILAKRIGSMDSAEHLELDTFSQIHYRVDPPVDSHYLHPLMILASHPKIKNRIVNPFELLVGTTEKLLPLTHPLLRQLSPATLVSAHREELMDFLSTYKTVVLKPLNSAMSQGVHQLTSSPRTESEMKLQAQTSGFTHPVVLQAFLPQIEKGETRLWFADHELVAHARKLPLSGDFRVNVDAGSSLERCSLTANEKKAAAVIGRVNRALGIRLSAVDLIGGQITDYNFTSPGLIPQMEKTLGQAIAPRIAKRLLKRSNS